MGESRIGEVFVDFISDDLDAVSDADVSVAGKFFLRPHAADRVVRGAEEGKLHVFCFDLCFEVVEVKFIMIVLEDERAVHQFPSVLPDGFEEGVVDRAVDEDAVAFLCQCFDGKVDGRNDARGFDEPFGLDIPAVVFLLPVLQRFEVGFAGFRVAEDAMVDAFPQGVKDGFSHFEVHVSDPEGKNIGRFAALNSEIIFQAAGSAAVDDGIKIR